MPALDLGTTKGVCDIAYEGVEGDRYRFPDGSIWRIGDDRGTWTSGFKGIVVAPERGATKTVLAFAGTDSLLDVIVDAAQVTGQLPAQYIQALAWAQELSRTEGSRLVLAGHSLGGGLAAYSSVATGLPACTVNPAPLVGAISLDSLGANEQITNYIGNEFVSSSPGRNPGTDIEVPTSGGFLGFFSDHLLANIAPGIALPVKL